MSEFYLIIIEQYLFKPNPRHGHRHGHHHGHHHGPRLSVLHQLILLHNFYFKHFNLQEAKFLIHLNFLQVKVAGVVLKNAK